MFQVEDVASADSQVGCHLACLRAEKGSMAGASETRDTGESYQAGEALAIGRILDFILSDPEGVI